MSKNGKQRKPTTIQNRLDQLKGKLEHAPPIAISVNAPVQKQTADLTQLLAREPSKVIHSSERNAGPLAPIPFLHLGRWIVHAIHSVFGDQHDTVRQLTSGLRAHVATNRREYNEHRKNLKLLQVLEKLLPAHLFKLVNRMNQLFEFREGVYLKGTQDLAQYLTLMTNRAQSVARELKRHEDQTAQILDEWTAALEKDRDVLVGRVRQSADCENPSNQTMFGVEASASNKQLDHLLDEGKGLFDKIEELRKFRVEAIVGGNRELAREIEKHLRGALSKAHAITGARQYFYTARGSPELVQFTTSEDRLKDDLTKLLKLPKLYYNDYELAAKQFQSTIDENIGGMRLFATLKLRQEFLRAATELEEELCSQVDMLFRKVQGELKLLDSELDVLNTEFLAEFARSRLDEELREYTAKYIKALYVASDCKLSRIDEQFLALVSSPLKEARHQVEEEPAPVHVEVAVHTLPSKTDMSQKKKDIDSDSETDSDSDSDTEDSSDADQ